MCFVRIQHTQLPSRCHFVLITASDMDRLFHRSHIDTTKSAMSEQGKYYDRYANAFDFKGVRVYNTPLREKRSGRQCLDCQSTGHGHLWDPETTLAIDRG